MYRSNDIVQFDTDYIYIRPFIKVGEAAEKVKVHKFYLRDSVETSQHREVCKALTINPESENGPGKISSCLAGGKRAASVDVSMTEDRNSADQHDLVANRFKTAQAT